MHLIIALVAVVGGAWLLRDGVLQTRTLLRLRATPRLTLRSLRAGLVRVSGRVLPPDRPLRSPLSGRACSAYRVVVLVRANVGNSWQTLVDEASVAPVRIGDGTGEVELDLAGAERHFAADRRARSSALRGAPAELERVLQRHGESSAGLVFNKTLRCAEMILETGDPVHVLGNARSLDGRWRIAKDGGELVVSDKGERALGTMALSNAIGGLVLGPALITFGCVMGWITLAS